MIDFSVVRARIGGLKGLISKLGDQPPDHRWNGFPKCPFCGHKDSASVFKSGDAEFSKCHFSRCSSGGRCVAEVGYINLRLTEAMACHCPEAMPKHTSLAEIGERTQVIWLPVEEGFVCGADTRLRRRVCLAGAVEHIFQAYGLRCGLRRAVQGLGPSSTQCTPWCQPNVPRKNNLAHKFVRPLPNRGIFRTLEKPWRQLKWYQSKFDLNRHFL